MKKDYESSTAAWNTFNFSRTMFRSGETAELRAFLHNLTKSTKQLESFITNLSNCFLKIID